MPARAFARAISLAALALSQAGCGASGPELPPVTPGTHPAFLAVEGTPGAVVAVDGVEVGALPLRTAVAADPGPHRVDVRSNGHEPASRQVRLDRGKVTSITIELEETAQRTGAWVAIGAGAAGLSTGIVLGVLAVVEGRRADDLEGFDGGEYQAAVDARDRYRVGSGIAGGTGLGLFVLGACLFAFDEAPAPGAPERSAPSGSVSLVPWLEPGGFGAAARGTY